MNYRSLILLCLSALLPMGAYADTKIIERHQIVTEKISKPAHIWVHDFAATADELPPDSALADKVSEHSKPQTPEQIDTGRKVGAGIAAELVKQIKAMGMPAQRATDRTSPQVNDIVIRGYLLSVDAGSKKKRVGIGFGSGSSEVKAAAEGFQVTDKGLRKLGGGSADSEGGKMPGASLGAVGVIAMHNPLGLIISTGMKEHDEKTGKSTLAGREKDIAKEIASVLRKRFEEQGWIEKQSK